MSIVTNLQSNCYKIFLHFHYISHPNLSLVLTVLTWNTERKTINIYINNTLTYYLAINWQSKLFKYYDCFCKLDVVKVYYSWLLSLLQKKTHLKVLTRIIFNFLLKPNLFIWKSVYKTNKIMKKQSWSFTVT